MAGVGVALVTSVDLDLYAESGVQRQVQGDRVTGDFFPWRMSPERLARRFSVFCFCRSDRVVRGGLFDPRLGTRHDALVKQNGEPRRRVPSIGTRLLRAHL